MDSCTPVARRRWLAGAVLILTGWLATPQAVVVYDGVAAPDQPYRYVKRPPGAPVTAAPTTSTGTTPVVGGRSRDGVTVETTETGPQESLYLAPQSLSGTGTITVTATPSAPTSQPPQSKIDGNVYTISLTSTGGPVTLTEKAALATIYLRATTSKQPGPTLFYKTTTSSPWSALRTSRGGQDFYVARFPGAGQFALAFPAKTKKSFPALPVAALAVAVLFIVVILIVRLKAHEDEVPADAP